MSADGTPAFFARVTASVSHEIKNVLATISESAGLLGDLLDLTPDVGALDREEVLACAATISSEIRRGFTIVKNLNRFAHSADEPIAPVDLREAAALAAGLAAYLRKSCSVEIEPGDEPVTIRTNPVRMLEVLHRLLAAAFEVVGAGGRLAFSVRTEEDGAGIRLSGAPGVDVLAAAGEDAVALAGSVDAILTAAGDELRIRVSSAGG